MGTKNNPGPYDCYAKLELDEPHFVLRGKDPCAWFLVMLWVHIREALLIRNHEKMTPEYQAKLDEALRCAHEMRSWPIKSGGPKDVGHTESLANPIMHWFEKWKEAVTSK